MSTRINAKMTNDFRINIYEKRTSGECVDAKDDGKQGEKKKCCCLCFFVVVVVVYC